VGIQGSGKTTSASKLTWYLKKQGYTVGLVCADNFRAGAYDQLMQLAQKTGAEFYGERDSPDAAKIASNGVRRFREGRIEVILVDTAGRHKNEADLIDEMKRIADAVSPDEIILVLDGTIGQQAMQQAEAFNNATKVGTIFLTKLDGSARGGGAISAVAATKAPIRFIGTGEGPEEIEVFSPPRFVGRLLGMGDIVSLVEKAQQVVNQEEAAALQRKMLSEDFTLQALAGSAPGGKKWVPSSPCWKCSPDMAGQISEEDLNKADMKPRKRSICSMTKRNGRTT